MEQDEVRVRITKGERESIADALFENAQLLGYSEDLERPMLSGEGSDPVLDERALPIAEQVRAHVDLTDPQAIIGHLSSRGLGFLRASLPSGICWESVWAMPSPCARKQRVRDGRQTRERFWADLCTETKHDLAP